MAAKGIKGITIEIGGNTTPLQKALTDVNKKSASLKTELRDVERLLKLDPTNVTLLAQKQELLAKSVSNTGDKLEQLKAVQEQVKQQFANGEIDEGQYRAFERELAKTEGELKKVESQADDTGDEVKEAGDKAEKSGRDAASGGDKWEKFGSSLKKVGEIAGKAIIGLGTAAIGAGTAIAGMTVNAAYSADEINTIAKQTGLSTEAIQKFQYASEQIDVPLETLTGSMAKLTRNMSTARGGTGAAAEAFDMLGVSITDSNGQLRDSETVFNEAIAALGGIENETERDAAAMAIFGKSAQDLNPLILGGADALKELGDEAEAAGLILSQDALDSLNTLSDAMDTAKATTKGLGNLFSTVFAEDFAGIVNEFTGYAQQLGKAFEEGGVDGLVEEIGTVLGEIVNKITEALPKIIEAGLTIVEKLAEAVLDNAPLLAESAVEIVTMLAETLIGALPEITKAGMEIISTLIESIAEQLPTLIPFIVQSVVDVALTLVEQLPTLLDAVLQLIEGLAIGIIEALPIIIDTLPDIIQGIIDALIGFIPKLIECGIKIFVALVENLDEIIMGIVEAVPEIINSIIDALTDLIPLLVECGVKLFVAIIQNLPQIIWGIIKAVPKIVEGIISTFKNLFSSIGQVGKDLFMSLISRSGEYISAIVQNVRGLVQNLIENIRNFFSGFADVGRNLVEGIWNGISAGWNWLTSKVSSLASSLLNAAKNALGIHSPSTVFRDQIGKMLSQGIAVGFEQDTPKTFSRIKNKLVEQEEKLSAAVTNTSTVNNTTSLGGVNVYITGNVGNVAEAQKLGDAIGERVQRAMRYKGVLNLA